VSPKLVVGCDESAGYVRHASEQTIDDRARFAVASVGDLPAVDGGFDACVSGLVLNFVPDVGAGLADCRRAARPGGTVAAYVWDYADGMQFMRVFWDAAAQVDPAATELDEASRFPVATAEGLAATLTTAGLGDVQVAAIEIPTVFTDFDDLWTPFLGGQGSAPSYLATLDETAKAAVREAVRERVVPEADGSIPLVARAWAGRGRA